MNWIALVPIMFPPLAFTAQLPLGIDIYEDKEPWKRSSKHACFIRVKRCCTKSHMILSLSLLDWFTYICSQNFQQKSIAHVINGSVDILFLFASRVVS